MELLKGDGVREYSLHLNNFSMTKKQDVKRIKRLKKGIIKIASKNHCQLPRELMKILIELCVLLEELSEERKKSKFQLSKYLVQVLKFISKVVRKLW